MASLHRTSEKGTTHSRKIRMSKDPDQRRQEIIEVALEVFSKNGYENTTIQDIAERMNVSPGLCYRYFRSKTDIFAASSEYYAVQAVKQIQLPISADMAVTEKIDFIMKRMFDFSIEHSEFEAKYKEESSIRAIFLDDVAYQWVLVMTPIIEQGIKEGIFHCHNASRTASFLIFGLVHAFHDGMPEKDTEEYMHVFFKFSQDMMRCVLKM
jgi:AcrR family transcriptional regulator